MFLQERRGDGNMLSNVKGFVILWPVEGLASFNKDNSANFSGEKSMVKLSEVLSFLVDVKNVKSNLVLVVVLILKSKGL